jgi:hypothetical protein
MRSVPPPDCHLSVINVSTSCGEEPFQEQPAEQAREHTHWQEEAWPARHPARAVERDAPARHDHMDVGMVGECRAPGMENRGDADAGSKVLGVGRDGGQGLGRRLEQDVVDLRLVLAGDVADRRRQGEHDQSQLIGHLCNPTAGADWGAEEGGKRRTLAQVYEITI